MAPSLKHGDEIETEKMQKKRKTSNDFTTVEITSEVNDDADGSKKRKKKKKKDDLPAGCVEVELVGLVAKYLDKRGLLKTLSAFLSETQCKNSWKTQTLDLEDIFSHYSNQDSEISIKDKAVRKLEQDIQVAPPTGTFSGSGSLKQGIFQSDKSGYSCDDVQDEHKLSEMAKNRKRIGKNIEPDSEKIAKKKDYGVPTGADRENRNSVKESTGPTNLSNESEHALGLDRSLHDSLKEKRKKRKKSSEEKDAGNNDQQNGSDKNEKEKWALKKKPAKPSNESENVLELDESLHSSLKVPKEKRKEKKSSGEKDFGNNEEKYSGEKNEKQKKAEKKKMQLMSSQVANGAGSVKDSAGDRNKLVDSIQDHNTSQAKNVVEGKAAKSVHDSTDGNEHSTGSAAGQEEGINVEENGGNASANSKKNGRQKSDVPTEAKAFQRVKVEEVKFVDPRLQDNSYWAKSGAERGYGAKAEEVLGQVRGKDFRHEKTKKKRGSYKGGMIDLQSHSIKFSYSDEE
eukprot:Gb_10298 [translate_table: standard]